MEQKEKKQNKLVEEMCNTKAFNDELSGEETSTVDVEKAKKKAKRTIIFRVVFIIISIGIILGLFFAEFQNEDLTGLISIINASKTSYLLWFALLCLVINTLMQTFRLSLVVKNYTGKFHPILSYKVSQLGRYYDNLTPSSVGGQPAQIYYFHKNGMTGSDSSGMTVIYFLAFQFAFIIIGWVSFIANKQMINYGALNVLGYVALVFHGLFPAFLIIASLNRKLGKGILNFVFMLGKKFKIIKEDKYEAKYSRALRALDSYADKLTHMFKNFGKLFLPQILLTIVEILFYASIPYFAIMALGGDMSYSWFDVLTVYMFTHCASSIMPTPGMTGGAELVFLTCFAVFLKGSPLFWAMVIWRFMTFYFYLIQGLAITIYDNVKNGKKVERVHAYTEEKLNEIE